MKTTYLKTKEGSIIQTDSPQYWSECQKLTSTEGKKLYREQQAETLRKWIKPGDTVYCILRHVSSSGMSRRISLIIKNKSTGELQDISGYAGDVLGWRKNRDDNSLIVSGCGMDMGFHTVYSLSSCLYRDGFGVEGVTSDGRKVRATSKKNAEKMRNHTAYAGLSFRGRNGDPSGWDNDGGYALEYRWL